MVLGNHSAAVAGGDQRQARRLHQLQNQWGRVLNAPSGQPAAAALGLAQLFDHAGQIVRCGKAGHFHLLWQVFEWHPPGLIPQVLGDLQHHRAGRRSGRRRPGLNKGIGNIGGLPQAEESFHIGRQRARLVHFQGPAHPGHGAPGAPHNGQQRRTILGSNRQAQGAIQHARPGVQQHNSGTLGQPPLRIGHGRGD